MKANDREKETSIAVVTMPPPPSAIAAALQQTGLAHASLVSTGDAFERLAEAAVDSFTVMTPFLNWDVTGFRFEAFRAHPSAATDTNCTADGRSKTHGHLQRS